MKIVFETRFSFFGQSGWRSEASKDPGKLFDSERLDARLEMFARFTLASLACQSDAGFDHVILSSEDMPAPYKKRLTELCKDVLGDRAQVVFKPFMSAGHAFRQHIRQTYQGESHVAQVVLDDDDAVSFDFVMALRYQSNCIILNPVNTDPATFVSFPRGLSIGLDNGQPAWLSPRNVPYTNLGLAMVGPPGHRKNPYMTSHRKIGQRMASHVVGAKRPFYLRAVHDHNDSRAISSDERLDWDATRASFQYFPFLEGQFDLALERAA
ncbi:MAG: hypothetical protein GY945_02880 [Rhodobacteraceae bacterium]|nr:hypothetical protein [Paracoccaceae bacterium]